MHSLTTCTRISQVRVADLEKGQAGLTSQATTHTAQLDQMYTTLTSLSKAVEGVRGLLQSDIDARCEAAAELAQQQAQAAAGRQLLVLRDAMVQTSPLASDPRSAEGAKHGTFRRRKSLVVRQSLMVEEEYEEIQQQNVAGDRGRPQDRQQHMAYGYHKQQHEAAFCGVATYGDPHDEVNSGSKV